MIWWDLSDDGLSFNNTLIWGHDDMGHLLWNIDEEKIYKKIFAIPTCWVKNKKN
jgi:hypothetical protein